MVHQLVRKLDGRLIDPADNIFRRASGDSRLQYDIRRFVGGVFGARMWREDNTVTGFQADQRFKDSGGCRVGGRNDTADQAGRLGDGDGAESIVSIEDAAGFSSL